MPFDADVNGDGVTDAADAQTILDYVSGKLGEEEYFDDYSADADGDSEVTTYDAYLILEALVTPEITITEPTEITVNIYLYDDYKEYFDDYYEGGAYIEGYTYLIPSSDEEGELSDVELSIPIIGYYGSWTDASMFDRTSYLDSYYGTGKTPYFTETKINYFEILYPGDDEPSATPTSGTRNTTPTATR